jgi:hypothetical protein
MFPAMNDRSGHELDDVTADRLLEGAVAPDDAPPGYQDVARALQAAALMATDAPTHDAGAAVSAFLDATPSRRTPRMKKWKIAAAALAGGLTLSTGLAAADVLPGPAQEAASSALSHVGIHVPDRSSDDDTNVTTVDDRQEDKVANDDDPATHEANEHPDNHGADVSSVAKDDSTEGAEHGAAVCAVASDDKCQAGEDHGASADAGTTGDEHRNDAADDAGDDTPGEDNSGANRGQGSEHSGTGAEHSGGHGNSTDD